MKIVVADSAGFCFGVSRAVNMVNKLVGEGKKVYTLGPIIHNPQMVETLARQGVEIADSPEDVQPGAVLVVRSHGVPMATIEKIKGLNLDFVDATCPFVSKIHGIVRKASDEKKVVLIAGDKNHPEVEGIRGNCPTESYVFKNKDDLLALFAQNNELLNREIVVVAQTTFNIANWKSCLDIIKKLYTNATIFDTICNATLKRQAEVEKLSKIADIMIIIGGKHSSNTAKLRDIAQENCRTFLIETQKDLPFAVLSSLKSDSYIGITAGASTPACIIEEVIEKMTENVKNFGVSEEETSETELNFEEMLEESLKSLNTDDKVRGVVVGIAPNEIYVDIGRKHAGFVPASELSADPNVKTEEMVKIGDELDLLIMKTNDQEGTIMLSKKRVDALKGWEDVVKAYEEGTVLEGVVTNVVNGGVIAVTNGVKVFIPASHSMHKRGEPLDDMLKKEISFKIIDVNTARRRAVASIKALANEERKKLADKFWENVQIGDKYTGQVRSITSYGAFVDLGGVDGMVHISELSWQKIKHPTEVVNIGDTVEVYIRDLDEENRKISLGYKKTEDNPWEILRNDYPIGTVVEAEIVGLTSFGAFARVLPGVDGLIHISQIADHKVEDPKNELSLGQKVKAIITDVDFERQRLSLSMTALGEADEDIEQDTTEE